MNDFPSGQWVGFYTYSHSSQRFLMDLVLEFKGGAILGEGADGIGEFIIEGKYSASGGECRWTKTYVGRHSVAYRGFRGEKGIWGTWTLIVAKGGFHIWPIGQNSESFAAEVTEEEPLPV